MKNPLVAILSKWMLRAYIVWSLCLDVTLIAGILYYFFIY
jgi:hypothetical protein